MNSWKDEGDRRGPQWLLHNRHWLLKIMWLVNWLIRVFRVKAEVNISKWWPIRSFALTFTLNVLIGQLSRQMIKTFAFFSKSLCLLCNNHHGTLLAKYDRSWERRFPSDDWASRKQIHKRVIGSGNYELHSNLHFFVLQKHFIVKYIYLSQEMSVFHLQIARISKYLRIYTSPNFCSFQTPCTY